MPTWAQILVGLMTSIAGALLLRMFDSFRLNQSGKQKIKNKKTQIKVDDKVKLILSHPEEREFFYYDTIKKLILLYAAIFLGITMVVAIGYLWKSETPITPTPKTISEFVNALWLSPSRLITFIIEVALLSNLIRSLIAVFVWSREIDLSVKVDLAWRKRLDDKLGRTEATDTKQRKR